jgi:CyaY protein
MDESTYYRHAKTAFTKVEDALDALEEGAVDFERSGDVLTIVFSNGKKCVLNTQRPTRQLWLAADARAWHFSFDEARGTWLDDKGQGIELFAQLSDIVKAQFGKPLAI